MDVPSGGPFTRSTDAVATPVGDRIVLYHNVSRTALVLNPTGGWIWSRLDAPRTQAELVADLRQRFPTLSADAASADVEAFIAQLLSHKFVAVS